MLSTVPHAGLHSSPNRSSTGRALNWVKPGQPLTHGATLFVASSLPWATGGHVVERVGSDVTAFFIRSEAA